MKKRERSCAPFGRTSLSLPLLVRAVKIIETVAVTAICPDDIKQSFIGARTGLFPASLCLQVRVFVDASAVPVPELAPERVGRSENKTAATGIAGCDGTLHSTPDGRRSTKKIWQG
jgi:hypothetical protein